jgi:hypothetical protein
MIATGKPLATALACLGIAFAGIAAAQTEDAQPVHPEAADVEACLRRNLPQRSSIQSVRFETRDRMGGSRTLSGTVYWKKWKETELSRSLIQLDFPPDLRGSAYLLIERPDTVDVFVYLPEYQKVRRITSHALSGSLFGTDFSYEDMRRLRHLMESAKVERLPDTDVSGRRSHAIRLLPPDESEYGEVIAWVDVDTCVPLKIELYARGGGISKDLVADPASLTQHGNVWVAHSFTLHDHQENTETRLELGKLEIDVDIPDRTFSERMLTQGK